MTRERRDISQKETVDLRPESDPSGEAFDVEIGTLVGRFRVERTVGRGGMGTVVAAHDPDLDRIVAIKLFRGAAPGSGSDSSGRERLVSEARAMARLSHPNILAVHEVGIRDDIVFIAMEYARGGTLTTWLEARPRRWSEIVARFIEAGRGLAAAHAGGIVHRDFKPDNVLLLVPDGRVCVADFGLAGSGPEPASDEALMGTPLYMAPEQFEGRAPDARADQFSFCVALFEALYGERPFGGALLSERLAAIQDARLQPAPPGSSVPPWIRAALRRGLAADPAARFPSMDALLDALRSDPSARRRRLLTAGAAAAVVAVLAALAVAGLLRDPRASLCRDGAAEVAKVWNGPVRERMLAAFEASGVGHARASFDRVSSVLDRYSGAWAAMRDEACAATNLRGTQSGTVLDLRMRCLDERRAALRVSVAFLAAADSAAVQRAMAAASGLDPVADCADLDALSAPVAEPSDPAARARLARLREAFAETGARLKMGRIQEATALAAIHLATARALAHPPVLAQALFGMGVVMTRSGDARAAEALLREAVQMAGRGRSDNLAVLALAELVFALDRQGRSEEALALRPWAEMELARGGVHEITRAKLLLMLAVPLRTLGRLDEARALLEEAIAIRQRVLGADHIELAAPLNNLGNVLAGQGRLPEARSAFERAVAINEATVGPDHPEVAYGLTNLAIVLRLEGQPEESRRRLERALAIREASIGADHPEVARTLDNLGDTLAALGRYDEARRALVRALAIKEKRLRADHPDLIYTLTALGKSLLAQGQAAEAATVLERAVAIQSLAPPRPDHADTLFAAARALDASGRDRERAVDLARRARALVDAEGKDAHEIDAWLGARKAGKMKDDSTLLLEALRNSSGHRGETRGTYEDLRRSLGRPNLTWQRLAEMLQALEAKGEIAIHVLVKDPKADPAFVLSAWRD